MRESPVPTIETVPVIHTVVFRLRPDAGPTFLEDARRILEGIPGVQDFRIRHQVSPKSDLTHQFHMVFADAEAYRAYDTHPDHVAFVAERWLPEVESFQEYDFTE